MYVDVQNIYSHVQWIIKRTSTKYKHIIYSIFNHIKEKQTQRPRRETVEVTADFCLLPSGPSLGHAILGPGGENGGRLCCLNCSFLRGCFFNTGLTDFTQVPGTCGMPFLYSLKNLLFPLAPIFTAITFLRCPSSSDSHCMLV